MAENIPDELTNFEEMLTDALKAKANKFCPSCGHNKFFFMGPTTGPWLVLCCQNCGFKLEYLIDILTENTGGEKDDVS